MIVRMKDPFEELLQRYRGLLYTLCKRYSHRGLELDDLLQEATVAIWRSRALLFPLSGPQQAALLWKVARNAVIDALRRYRDHDELPEGYDAPDDDRALLHELHEQIALLEEPDRSIVQMQLDGFSYEEIGTALQMTEKNVSVRLVRAREKLRTMMRR